MDVCIPSNKPAFPDKSSHGESLTSPCYSTDKPLGDLSMNDLKICLTEYLNTENIEISTGGFDHSLGDNGKCNIASEDECKDSDRENSDSFPSEKCYSIPIPSVRLLREDKQQEDSKTSRLNDCAKSVDRGNPQSSPLSTPPELVSAMKGSREKRGILPKKLSVTWDPNVIDPIPTSVSHVPSSKNQRYHNNGRKYGRKKQKGGGKFSQGGKSKDKKQPRNNSSGCSTKLKPSEDDGVLFSVYRPEVGVVLDDNGVRSDSLCGSSFRKKSIVSMSFPVAEAM